MIGLLTKAATGEFSSRAAIVLALASARSYWKKSQVCRELLRAGVRFQRIKAGSHVADITTDGEVGIVSFRGTDDVKDWLANLSMDRVSWRGNRVHRGFHDAESRLARRLLKAMSVSVSTWWITGHSLGGSIATLFAYRLRQLGHDVAGLYTFGSPRVGDRCFAAQHDWLLKDRHYRVVHNSDVVPRVPLPWRFRHCGTQVLINRRAELLIEPSLSYQWYDRVLGYRLDWVRDHLMGAYLSGLLNNRGTEIEDREPVGPASDVRPHLRRVVDDARDRSLGT